MSLDRLLQIGVATLAVLGTLMLSMGQGYVALPVLALIVSVSSVYLTDIKGWLRLNTTAANIAGVVAVVIAAAAADLNRFGDETHLLALANMLAYMQFILLYQRKTVRIYWLLIVLSLLQTAVATALNLGVTFGVILMIYTVVGVTSLVLLFLRGETVRFAAQQNSLIPERPHGAGADSLVPDSDIRQTAWPLDIDESVLNGRVQVDPADHVLNRALVLFLAKTIAVTIALTGLIFFAIPRLEQKTLSGPTLSTQHTVGASEEVELGELGEIIANPEAVMRVEFYDENGNALHLKNEPMLRGVVLLEYENGAWKQGRRSDRRTFETERQVVYASSVRQRITIEPLDARLLYAVYPVASITPVASVQFDERRRQLTRTEKVRNTRFTYELLTLGIENQRLRSIYPSSNRIDLSRRRGRFTSLPENDALRARLIDLANEQLGLAGASAGGRYEKARALESFLRDPENFTYTLDLPRRNPQLDPIEQYLFDTRQGHCEYSATALVLLLRSVGIESRLIIGFKGGEWNRLGRFYLVRQLHAHAWVEAYLPPDQIPARLERLFGNWDHGAWLVLDPTPTGGRAQLVEDMTGRFVIVRQMTDYAEFLWSSYVIGMTANRQQEIIYTPLVDGAASLFTTVLNRNTWREAWQTATRFLRLQFEDWLRGELFSWRAGLAFVVVCLVLLAMFFAVRFLMRRLIRWIWSGSASAQDSQGRQVAFYRRLEKLLAGNGLHRGSGQTQREFAHSAGLGFADATAADRFSSLASLVVESFYRVRFGGRALDGREQASVERALIQLENVLSSAESRPAGSTGAGDPSAPNGQR